MQHRNARIGIGWFAGWVLALGVAGAAGADPISQDQLLQEVRQLRGEVAQLREAQASDWLNEGRAEQVKALVREVLADADARASLMDAAVHAGHNGKHFFLASADGNFEMAIGGQVQVRYIANFRDLTSPLTGSDDEGEAGFQIRRTKVYFEGHVINPRVHFALQLAASRDTQTVSPDKIVIGYDVTDDLHVWAGEDKAPFMREELISSKRQLAVDRAVVTEAFTLDKVQGVGFKWQAHDQLRVAGMLHDGMRSGEAPGDDWVGDEWLGFRQSNGKDFDQDATDFAIVGRADLLLAGDWAQWKDFTSWPGEELFAYVGAAIDYEVGETGDTLTNDNWLTWTLDAAIEYQGFSFSAAYVGASTDFDTTAPGAGDYDPWGLVVQGAYHVDLGNGTSIEPFVRYEYLDLDDLGGRITPGRNDDASLITLGGNWYHAKHNAKLTADLVWALDPLHSDFPGITSGVGVRHDDPGKDDQLALRLQYQLLF